MLTESLPLLALSRPFTKLMSPYSLALNPLLISELLVIPVLEPWTPILEARLRI